MNALPMLTTDAVVLFTNSTGLRGVGIITRPSGVFAGSKSLPGALVQERERVADAARRAAGKIPGLNPADLVLVKALPMREDPDRDPRGDTRSIPVLFATQSETVPQECVIALDDLPVLAFDHAEIIADLRRSFSLNQETLRLLPELTGGALPKDRVFTTGFARAIIEQVGDTSLDPGNTNRALKANFTAHGSARVGGTLWC